MPEKKSQEFSTAREFAEYLYAISHDRIPERIHLDAVYVFGETIDNQRIGVLPAAKLYQEGKADKVLICGGVARKGYSGAPKVRELLIEAGVPEEKITEVEIPVPDEQFHSKSEAEAVVAFCKEHSVNNIAVAAPVFHLPRTFASIISAALETGADDAINAWAVQGTVPGEEKADWWKEKALHSQGKAHDSRIKLFQGELDRIYDYYTKGWLKSWGDIQAYMQRRDRRIRQHSES